MMMRQIILKKLELSRIKEGVPLIEVYYALYLEKKVLWSFVAWKDEVQEFLKLLMQLSL